jgi:hypothetical protein
MAGCGSDSRLRLLLASIGHLTARARAHSVALASNARRRGYAAALSPARAPPHTPGHWAGRVLSSALAVRARGAAGGRSSQPGLRCLAGSGLSRRLAPPPAPANVCSCLRWRAGGVRRLTAAEGGLPSAPPAVGRVPPAPCGLLAAPLPARGGGVPPPAPSIPCGAGRGNVAAKAGQARPGQVGRLRCSGAPFRAARPSPCGAHSVRPCPAPPPRRLRRWCSRPRPPHCVGLMGVRGRLACARPLCGRACVAAASPSPPAASEPGLSAGGSLACAPSGGLS